jgi:hypothetical protein
VVRTLISLYVRAGVSVANLALRVAVRGADLAADAVRMAVPGTEDPVWAEPEPARARPPEPAGEPTPAPRPLEVGPPEAIPEPAPEVDGDPSATQPVDESSYRAKTIDDEPELVAEVAEPGAEDGASAEVQVEEPWQGYDDLAADDVIKRIRQADAAVLAVVELYERSHKQRQTVLAAAERRGKELANAPS